MEMSSTKLTGQSGRSCKPCGKTASTTIPSWSSPPIMAPGSYTATMPVRLSPFEKAKAPLSKAVCEFLASCDGPARSPRAPYAANSLPRSTCFLPLPISPESNSQPIGSSMAKTSGLSWHNNPTRAARMKRFSIIGAITCRPSAVVHGNSTFPIPTSSQTQPVPVESREPTVSVKSQKCCLTWMRTLARPPTSPISIPR